MNLKGQAPSTNFEDRTGWTERQRKVHSIATLLNPALAAHKLHDWMRANGLAPTRNVELGKPGITDILKRD